MKQLKHINFPLLFFAVLLVFSCVREDIARENVFDESSLNATGQAFMDAVKTRYGWEQEWQDISKMGTPLPNETINMSCLPDIHFYVIPIVKGNKITGLVFYPFDRCKDENGEIYKELHSPEIIDENLMNTSRLARIYLESAVFEGLKEKGYNLSVELSPME